MAVIEATEWLKAHNAGTWPAYVALLSTLVGEEQIWRLYERLLGIKFNKELIKYSETEQVFKKLTNELVREVVNNIPRKFHSLLYRAVASTAILTWDISRVKDETLLSWLYKVSSRAIPVESDWESDCDLVCLLKELMNKLEASRGLVYGLKRLTSMALVERRVDPLDYSAVALYLSEMHELVATMFARNLIDFFDTDNVLASELSYHVLVLLVFKHDNLPDDIADALRLKVYSPDSIVACRAHQLLEGQLNAETIDREYPKPCLVIARHRNNIGLYVVD